MKILIVDDDRVTRDLLKEYFEKNNYEVVSAVNGEDALKALAKDDFPLVLTDMRMLEVDGMRVLSFIKESNLRSVVILMTGFGTMEGAIEAIQQGAFDYISKPFKLNELKAVVDRAANHWVSLNSPNMKELSAAPLAARTVIGKSPQIVEVYKTLARATMSASNVLIRGESGTGKELVARAIHDNSARRREKFLAVNCGALSENLLESELFGHVKGSFTGAIANKLGLFEEADHGTIFLDEIGDITLGLQVKLLRVLQEGEFKPVGSTENRKVDVRIIAATHCDLESFVKTGRFREDLYYRLKVILMELPPLRDRMGDVPDLVSHFLARMAEKSKKKISHISDDAMALIACYPWPGNIRELEHAIERAVAMTRTTVLYPEDFPPEIAAYRADDSSLPAINSADGPPDSLEEVERNHILKVLQDAGYNKSKAAAILGIDRKTLHRKAQRYKIKLGGD